jgi:hypothetical protein
LYRRLFPFVARQRDFFSGSDKSLRGKALAELQGKELKERASNLQLAVAANRCILYFGQRLREFHGSDFSIAAGIISSLLLILLSMSWFAFIYYGLYKAIPTAFQSPHDLELFEFFRLSFDNMFFGSNSDVDFTSRAAHALSMYQRFLSAIIVVIFLAVLVNVKHQRHAREIDDTVQVIADAGKQIESHIVTEYKFETLDEAIDTLNKIESSFIEFILRVSATLGDTLAPSKNPPSSSSSPL